MGLDVYKYGLITDPVSLDAAIKDYAETEGNGLFGCDWHFISRFNMELWYGKNNPRTAELFEKFKDHIRTYVHVDAIDYDKLAEMYGELKHCGVYTRDGIPEEYDVPEGLRGDIDADDQSLENDIFAIYENKDGVYQVLRQSELPVYDAIDEVLFFDERGYCRKTHLPSIYKTFIGDCWYADDNSGLAEKDVRVVVMPYELDELKQQFEKDSVIQTWSALADDEIIYLCA